MFPVFEAAAVPIFSRLFSSVMEASPAIVSSWSVTGDWRPSLREER